jgi:hypothetical protein
VCEIAIEEKRKNCENKYLRSNTKYSF